MLAQGTATNDGLALLAATIENFIQRGPGCPQVVFATHFHELQQLDSISKSRLVAFHV